MRKFCLLSIIIGAFICSDKDNLFSFRAWSTSGVQTSSVATQIDREFNTFSVVCETNHFTTFVVLVDVTEGIK